VLRSFDLIPSRFEVIFTLVYLVETADLSECLCYDIVGSRGMFTQ